MEYHHHSTASLLFDAILCLSLAHLCTGMAVHPIAIPSGGQSCQRQSQPTCSTSASDELVIFLHGRLEADDHEDIFIPEPSELYGDFLSSLSDKLPAHSQILMPAYHEHYKDWKHEPRDLSMGPVSSAIGQVIHDHINQMQPFSGSESIRLTLISFSMGAAVLLKLLAHDPILSTKKLCYADNNNSIHVDIQRLILIEPVWRCWLPFAVSEAAASIGDPTKGAPAISDVPTLAIAGTNDDEVRHDSGSMGQRGMDGVRRSLRPFLPNVRVVEIEGGNHFGGLCSGVDNIATDGLGEGVVLPGLRAEIVGHISEFCS